MSAPSDAGWAAKTHQQPFAGLAKKSSADDCFPSAELLASERANAARKAVAICLGPSPGVEAGADSTRAAASHRRSRTAVKLGVADRPGAAAIDDLAERCLPWPKPAVEQGLFDAERAPARSATRPRPRKQNLAWWRGYWDKIGGHRNRIFGCADFERRPRLRHRRKLALAGPLPPALGQDFTEGQCAVLKVIADEVWRRGTCRLSRKEISDRAQASETVVYQATRKAVRHGLLGVKLRPQPGRKNLPNLLTVINTAWLKWIYSPKYRAMSEDREIEAEARCKLQQQQGAQRQQPQTDTYIKNADGVWNSQEVGDQRPSTIFVLRAAGPP